MPRTIQDSESASTEESDEMEFTTYESSIEEDQYDDMPELKPMDDSLSISSTLSEENPTQTRGHRDWNPPALCSTIVLFLLTTPFQDPNKHAMEGSAPAPLAPTDNDHTLTTTSRVN